MEVNRNALYPFINRRQEMKLIPTVDAVGHVLCHDLTQIIVGVTKDARFRKGHVVTKEDIPVLLSMGKENLYVWEKQPGMLHEDEGAEILCDAVRNLYMDKSEPKEGKIELTATIDGLLEIDTRRLLAINSIGEVMIATRSNHTPVMAGQKVAGMRVIPLLIEEQKMRRVAAIADRQHPVLSIHPYRIKTCTIIVTGNEILKGLVTDTFGPAVASKLAAYGVRTLATVMSGDEQERIVEEIGKAIGIGSDLVVCTGGMSVDPDDRTPGAIKESGARIVSYGAPVLPGAMFLLSYIGEVPVLGLPGCVMYAKRTIFDLLLPRVLAKTSITPQDIAALGNGGLCLGCKTCVFPDCSFGKGGL